MSEEPLMQQEIAVVRKVAGSSLTDNEVFSGHSLLWNLAIMKNCTHAPIRSCEYEHE